MAKLKIKDAAMTALGATGGAYIADIIEDKINDMITDNKIEIGAKLMLVAGGAYFATTSKGIMRDAAIAAIGQFGKGIANSAKGMISGNNEDISEELEGVYEEIEEAMNGNEPIISGNEPIISGNETIITGAEYDDLEGFEDEY